MHYIMIVLHLLFTLHKKYKNIMLRLIILYLFISYFSGIWTLPLPYFPSSLSQNTQFDIYDDVILFLLPFHQNYHNKKIPKQPSTHSSIFLPIQKKKTVQILVNILPSQCQQQLTNHFPRFQFPPPHHRRPRFHLHSPLCLL